SNPARPRVSGDPALPKLDQYLWAELDSRLRGNERRELGSLNGVQSQQRRQFPQLAGAEIGDRAKRHAAAAPACDVVAFRSLHLHRIGVVARPDEHVDLVQALLIDDDRDTLAVDVIEPAADELIALGAEVLDHRRELEPACKPRLYIV